MLSHSAARKRRYHLSKGSAASGCCWTNSRSRFRVMTCINKSHGCLSPRVELDLRGLFTLCNQACSLSRANRKRPISATRKQLTPLCWNLVLPPIQDHLPRLPGQHHV